MDAYEIFKDMAIILLAGKFMGLFARKLKAPEVAGEILAGLLIGPCLLNLVQPSDFLTQMAEIGVVLLMFSAGLDSDLKEIISSGPVALAVAMGGVVLPLVGGTGLYLGIYGFEGYAADSFYQALFLGCILTATSVSITVQALRELGHLKGRVGTIIMSAAIIDDVLGIIALTVICGFKDPGTSPVGVIIDTVLFFVFSMIAGYIVYRVFKWMDQRHPYTRRLPVLGLAFCMGMAYIAEVVFGIADITGAYVAGLVLSNMPYSAQYVEKKMDINSYTLFGPVFFASVGLNADISAFSGSILVFSLLFLVVGLVTKVVGCGLIALLCGATKDDALKIGVGMMNRGEVALIIAQKGLSLGLMSAAFFPAVIMLIIVSSLITPIALKILYAFKPEQHPGDGEGVKANMHPAKA